MPRKRDYQAEYARRIARGLGRGLSRSQSRGHPRVGETPASPKVKPMPYEPRLERGLKGLRRGKSLTASARMIGTSPERLRRYLTQADVIAKRKGRWVIADDKRPREVAFFSNAQVVAATVVGLANASHVGSYMAAVKQFLETNDPEFLEPFIGEGITDISGRTHPFETRPNVLYRLDAVDSEPFEQVYRIVM